MVTNYIWFIVSLILCSWAQEAVEPPTCLMECPSGYHCGADGNNRWTEGTIGGWVRVLTMELMKDLCDADDNCTAFALQEVSSVGHGYGQLYDSNFGGLSQPQTQWTSCVKETEYIKLASLSGFCGSTNLGRPNVESDYPSTAGSIGFLEFQNALGVEGCSHNLDDWHPNYKQCGGACYAVCEYLGNLECDRLGDQCAGFRIHGYYGTSLFAPDFENCMSLHPTSNFGDNGFRIEGGWTFYYKPSTYEEMVALNTFTPTKLPTKKPSPAPTKKPSPAPTKKPTPAPTGAYSEVEQHIGCHSNGNLGYIGKPSADGIGDDNCDFIKLLNAYGNGCSHDLNVACSEGSSYNPQHVQCGGDCRAACEAVGEESCDKVDECVAFAIHERYGLQMYNHLALSCSDNEHGLTPTEWWDTYLKPKEGSHFATCGRPGKCSEGTSLVDDSTALAVRCVSDTEISGWSHRYVEPACADRWENLWWESDVWGSCERLDYYAAAQFCATFGARLPTLKEAEDGCVASSGCGFDGEPIWTSDADRRQLKVKQQSRLRRLLNLISDLE